MMWDRGLNAKQMIDTSSKARETESLASDIIQYESPLILYIFRHSSIGLSPIDWLSRKKSRQPAAIYLKTSLVAGFTNQLVSLLSSHLRRRRTRISNR